MPSSVPPSRGQHPADHGGTAPAASPTRRSSGHPPRTIATRTAEAVSRAWHGHHGGPWIDVPVGVVAALVQLEQPVDGPDVTARLLSLEAPELWRLLEEIWALRWVSRPELVQWSRPLHAWLSDAEPGEQRVIAVRAVAEAAVKSGLLELTGSPDPCRRSRADVLGAVLTELRSHGARQSLGEFHTPPDVSEAMARMTLGGDPETGWFLEPAAGTGGMFRAAAQQLREAGHDPAAYGWAMTDVDPVAAACCAVNALVWGLGPNVVVARADSLTEPDCVSRALEQRQEIRAHRDRVVATARLLGASQLAAADLGALADRGEATA